MFDGIAPGGFALDAVVLDAQRHLAQLLVRTIAAGGPTHARYRRWLQAEQALLRAAADGIDDALRMRSGDFGETRRAWLLVHCNALRADATLLAMDLQAPGADTAPEPEPEPESEPREARPWCEFCITAHQGRPWRMLGASLLVLEAMAGSASKALDALFAMPGVADGDNGNMFLRRRSQRAAASRYRAAEMAVGVELGALQWRELAEGARISAALYAALLSQVLQPGAGADVVSIGAGRLLAQATR